MNNPQAPTRHALWRVMDVVGWLALGYILYTLYRQNNPEPLDPADFMMVDEVYVSDHVIGSNPKVIFDPTILQPFWASWSAKVYPANLTATACQGRGRNFYEPQDDTAGITLSRYLGADCLLLPGSYVIRTSWVLDNELVIRNTSNTFKVVENLPELEVPELAVPMKPIEMPVDTLPLGMPLDVKKPQTGPSVGE